MDLTPRPEPQRPPAAPADGRRSTAPPGRPSAALGARGEDLAAAFLADLGMDVIARNWRVAAGELRGEIDLVARDGDTLVIVEVKTRSSRAFGSPLEAVTPRKQAKLRMLAAAFARQSGIRVRALRCDVVGIVDGPAERTITHVRGAF